MVEELLLQQNGEFYPFGAVINNEGNLTNNVGHYDGDEFPLSQTKIDELKKYFEREIESNNIRAYAITFDSLAKRDDHSEKTDAIAIECYSKNDNQRIVYYFPYKLVIDTKIEFKEAWGITLS